MTTTLTENQRKLLEGSFKDAASSKSMINASYPSPRVEPVNAFGVLEPDVNDAVNKTYIVVEPAVPAPFLVLFYWNGDTTSIPAETSNGAPIRVKVPAELVIQAADKRINVIYSVLDPSSSTPVPSDPLSLLVGKYTPPVYPKPVITEASDGVLNVSALTADANLRVADWPQQVAGQKLWLTVISDPPIVLQNKWRPVAVPASGPLSRKLAKARLQTLKDGSTLTLKLEIGPDEQHLSPFSEASYAVKAVPDITSVTIDRVTDSKGTDIPNGGTTTDTSVTISGSVA